MQHFRFSQWQRLGMFLSLGYHNDDNVYGYCKNNVIAFMLPFEGYQFVDNNYGCLSVTKDFVVTFYSCAI